MNVEEFFEFINESGHTISTPPIHPFKKEWAKIKKSIAPHFYGDTPEALEKAFPNEDSQILEYRKNTYQAKTESPLVKAIGELHRLLSNAKHSIRFENDNMREYIDSARFNELSLPKFFFNIAIPQRILDPNAILLVTPKGEGLEDVTKRVDVDMNLISSDRIIFKDPKYKLLIYKGVKRNKYQNTLSLISDVLHVVTDVFYGEVKIVDKAYVLDVLYEHNLGFIPWVTLGGRAIIKYDNAGNEFIYYKSDFSPAIPYLNDAAIYDNQHKSVMLATCFPIKFVEGVTCNSCNGNGTYLSDDTETVTDCVKCSGSGKILFISPLAGYHLNPGNTKLGQDVAQPDPIRYFSPDVSTIQYTGEVAKLSLEKAENVLNINRALKQAQSGTAKELDKESEYIEVGKVSDDVYMKLDSLLEIVQGLVFMDVESEVIVNAPISFDLKTEMDLMQEFAESQKGQPAAIRFEAYKSYMDRRFSTDLVAKRIAELCPMYTSLYLYTITERVELLGSMQISSKDAIKATFVFDAVLHLYYETEFDIFESTNEQIKAEIDKVLQPQFDALKTTEIQTIPPDMQL